VFAIGKHGGCIGSISKLMRSNQTTANAYDFVARNSE